MTATIKPFNAAENDQRNTWLRDLTHEDVLGLITPSVGTCGHGCSTCDTSAFYLLFTPDKGVQLGGVVCLRAAIYWERLIERDAAENLPVEWRSELVRIPTAAQRKAAKQNIGWN